MRIVARDIHHRYGRRGEWVLRGVSLEVGAEAGSVALMGPSGSGKTTLLSILGGLQPPTKGTILLDGRSSSLLDSVSWIHQAAHGLGHRSVIDNVTIGLLANGTARRQTQHEAHDILDVVGLGHRTSASARTLSGGEMQRLGIARALAKGDRFILADEPTGQLDHTTSAKVLDALFAGTSRGLSIIVATHDSFVADRCDEVYDVDQGLISRRNDQ